MYCLTFDVKTIAAVFVCCRCLKVLLVCSLAVAAAAAVELSVFLLVLQSHRGLQFGILRITFSPPEGVPGWIVQNAFKDDRDRFERRSLGYYGPSVSKVETLWQRDTIPPDT